MNGVPVIDVSALEQAADSSNESSTTGEAAQTETHETDPIGQASPHFITVTGGYSGQVVFQFFLYLPLFSLKLVETFPFFNATQTLLRLDRTLL